MTLYEINQDLRQLLEVGYTEDCVDPETGEVDLNLLDQKWAELPLLEEDKINGTLIVASELENQAESIKREIARLKELQASKEAHASDLRERVAKHLLSTGRRQYETGLYRIGFRHSTRVVLQDTKSIEEWAETSEYDVLDTKVSIQPSKTKIGRLLKLGISVPGAAMEESDRIQIK